MNQSLPQHSGHGITAIVLGSLGIFILLLNITFWLLFRSNNQLGFFNQVLIGLLIFINISVIILGLISSFRGIFQQERKKTLAISGLVLNLFTLMLYITGIIIWCIRKYF